MINKIEDKLYFCIIMTSKASLNQFYEKVIKKCYPKILQQKNSDETRTTEAQLSKFKIQKPQPIPDIVTPVTIINGFLDK